MIYKNIFSVFVLKNGPFNVDKMGKRVLLRDRIDLIDRLSQTENFLSKRRLPFALKEGLLHKSCKVTDATFQGQVTKPLFFVV